MNIVEATHIELETNGYRFVNDKVEEGGELMEAWVKPTQVGPVVMTVIYPPSTESRARLERENFNRTEQRAARRVVDF